jgi:hypothetical protein
MDFTVAVQVNVRGSVVAVRDMAMNGAFELGDGGDGESPGMGVQTSVSTSPNHPAHFGVSGRASCTPAPLACCSGATATPIGTARLGRPGGR